MQRVAPAFFGIAGVVLAAAKVREAHSGSWLVAAGAFAFASGVALWLLIAPRVVSWKKGRGWAIGVGVCVTLTFASFPIGAAIVLSGASGLTLAAAARPSRHSR
jgi:hypothetical protein